MNGLPAGLAEKSSRGVRERHLRIPPALPLLYEGKYSVSLLGYRPLTRETNRALRRGLQFLKEPAPITLFIERLSFSLPVTTGLRQPFREWTDTFYKTLRTPSCLFPVVRVPRKSRPMESTHRSGTRPKTRTTPRHGA